MGNIMRCDIISNFFKANIFLPVRARVKASWIFTFEKFPKATMTQHSWLELPLHGKFFFWNMIRRLKSKNIYTRLKRLQNFKTKRFRPWTTVPFFIRRCFLLLLVQRELLFCQCRGSLLSFAVFTLGRCVTKQETRGSNAKPLNNYLEPVP